jgi:hypothetical protein
MKGVPLLPEIDQTLVTKVMRFYSGERWRYAEWSAGFCAVYLGLAQPEDDSCPEEVLNAIAYLVVNEYLRPRNDKRGITFYGWVDKPNGDVATSETEQFNFFD